VALFALVALGYLAGAVLLVLVSRTGPGEGDEGQDAELVARLKQRGGEFWRDEHLPGKPVVRVRANWVEKGIEVKDLYSFKRLQYVAFWGGTVRQGELKQLAARCPRIRSLALQWLIHIPDACAEELTAFDNLEELILECPSLVRAGVKHLALLKRLRVLQLPDTYLSDTGLHELTPLSNLRNLWLEHTNVTDKGMPDVATFKELESLNLTGTRVTDAGLPHLAGLKRLKSLSLPSTTTKGGRDRLRRALPGCKIVINGHPGTADQ
jgi:hypothetical protein